MQKIDEKNEKWLPQMLNISFKSAFDLIIYVLDFVENSNIQKRIKKREWLSLIWQHPLLNYLNRTHISQPIDSSFRHNNHTRSYEFILHLDKQLTFFFCLTKRILSCFVILGMGACREMERNKEAVRQKERDGEREMCSAAGVFPFPLIRFAFVENNS